MNDAMGDMWSAGYDAGDLEARKKWWHVGYEDRLMRELASGSYSKLRAISGAWNNGLSEGQQRIRRKMIGDELADLLDALTEVSDE